MEKTTESSGGEEEFAGTAVAAFVKEGVTAPDTWFYASREPPRRPNTL